MKSILTLAILMTVVSSILAKEYIGCFENIPGANILEGKIRKSSKMTIKLCVQTCSKAGDYLAGLENGRKCLCGKLLKEYKQLDDSKCSTPCKGNKRLKCGGELKVSVYTTHQKDVRYLGCVKDSRSRILEDQVPDSYAMTNKLCIAGCLKLGKAFAYTEYRIECFCGNHLRSEQKVDGNQCNLPCAGNKNEMCGGHWRGSLYKIK